MKPFEKIIKADEKECDKNNIELDFDFSKLERTKQLSKKVEDLIQEWAEKNILTYDTECPYCQKNVNNIIIAVKELKQKLSEVTL
jgi:hypothetical protein